MKSKKLYPEKFILWLFQNIRVIHPIDSPEPHLSYNNKPYTVEGLYGEWKKEKKKLKVYDTSK